MDIAVHVAAAAASSQALQAVSAVPDATLQACLETV